MNIKLQGLLNAVKYIEQAHGKAALSRVLAELDPHIAERIRTGVAIEWHPVSEFIALLEVAERSLGKKDGSVSRAIGAAGARENSRGLAKRAILYLASPTFVLKRVAAMWRQFNDEGEMRLLRMDEAGASIEVVGMTEPHEYFCESISGWSQVITETVGRKNPVVEHSECRARGHSRCVWNVVWDG